MLGGVRKLKWITPSSRFSVLNFSSKPRRTLDGFDRAAPITVVSKIVVTYLLTIDRQQGLPQE
jgi:hypothetical protein